MRITNPWLVVILLFASVIGPAIVFYFLVDMVTGPDYLPTLPVKLLNAVQLVLIFLTMPFAVIGSQMAVFCSLQRLLSDYGDFESIVLGEARF